MISPKINQVTMKEKQLKSQEQLLSVLQTKDTNTNSITVESTVALQKQVPVKPLTEQLLLDIEKAEVASGSFVSNMQFGDGEVEAQTELEQEIDAQLNTDGTTDETVDSNPETGEVSASSLPTGLKKVTVDMSVESPSYTELEKFITFLEQSERIVVVEAIDFSANDEIISTEQTDQLLTYQIKLSAFYMPTLSDLIDELPKLETPEPADKKNPFSSFGNYSSEKVQGNSDSITKEPPAEQETDNSDENTEDTTDDNTNTSEEDKDASEEDTDTSEENKDASDENTDSDEEKQEETDDIVERNGEKYKIITYKVQPNETLFDIAIEHYNNTKGVELILNWNNIKKPENLKAGTTIEIPIPVEGEI